MTYIKKLLGVSAGLLLSLTLTTPSVSAETMDYEVKVGDTLFRIAQSRGQSVEELIHLNGITSNVVINPGQTLKLPTESQANQQFIEKIGTSAEIIAEQNGLYASVMIAQAILESDFGKSDLALAPHYNLYGVKGSYNGNSALKTTNEFLDGAWTRKNDYFRSYPSYYTSLLNYANVLRQGNSWDNNYYQGVWVENTGSYKDATAWLENRYATDPNYAKKLNNIIARYNLTRFDTEKNEQKIVLSSNETTSISPNTEAGHTVMYGDTLFNISQRYGLSIAEIKRLNQLSSNNIVIGQSLNLGDASLKAHTVQAGDTLYNIALRYKLTVSELQFKNNLNSNIIKIGQTLNY